MRTLIGYVTRVFLAQLALMLTAFVVLMQILDLLNSADQLFRRHGDNPLVLLRYAGLRLPELVTFMLPFSVLMASLLALARLAHNNEVLALKAAGMSFYKLLSCFVPAAFAVAVLHFFFSDQLTPLAARALENWEAQSRAVAASQAEGARPAVWVRDGSTIARVVGILRDGNELRGLTLFLRDARGNLRQHLTARRAVYAGGAWRLFDVEPRLISSTGTVASEWLAEAPWQTNLTPDHFSDLSAPPISMSLNELAGFVANPGVGNRPTYFYETWLHKRLAIPVASFLMVLLAAPVAQGLRRHGGIAAGLTAGVGLGFLFFVTDGLVLALGEAGALPPALAAWSPTVLFASVGGAALIRMEGY